MLREINSISRPWHNLNWFAIKPTQYTVYSTCMCFASWLAKSPLRVYTATDMSACMLFNVPWIAHALVMQCFQVLLWLRHVVHVVAYLLPRMRCFWSQPLYIGMLSQIELYIWGRLTYMLGSCLTVGGILTCVSHRLVDLTYGMICLCPVLSWEILLCPNEHTSILLCLVPPGIDSLRNYSSYFVLVCHILLCPVPSSA